MPLSHIPYPIASLGQEGVACKGHLIHERRGRRGDRHNETTEATDYEVQPRRWILDLKVIREDMDAMELNGLIAIQHEVRADFGWAYGEDLQSAERMLECFNSETPFSTPSWNRKGRRATLEALKVALAEAEKIVFVGAAATRTMLKRDWSEGAVFIAADGSVGACLGLVDVLVVVTDLDGGIHLQEAAERGTPMVVHAHGDNQNQWATLLPQWAAYKPPMILTHQTDENYGGMFNVGGFTDGDRAVCLACFLGADEGKFVFVGYSTEHVGEWSGRTEPAQKLRKLEWMAKVLDRIHPAWKMRTA